MQSLMHRMNSYPWSNVGVGSVLSCRLRTYIKLQGTFLLFQQHLFPTLAPFNDKRWILVKRLHCIVVRFDNAQGFGLNQNPGCKHLNDEQFRMNWPDKLNAYAVRT